MTALYREPWFTDLAHLTDGRGYTVYAAGQARAGERGGVLPTSDLHLAFGPLSARARQDVQQALLALGLWSEAPGGFQVHSTPATSALPLVPSLVETPTPSSTPADTIVESETERVRKRREADRQRQQRHRRKPCDESRLEAPVTDEDPGCHASESAVTPSVTTPVTLRSRTSEDDLSTSPSSFSKLNLGEREESLPSCASEPVTVTPPAPRRAADIDSPRFLAAAAAVAPSPPLAATETPAASGALEHQVLTRWSQIAGQPAHTATPSDLAAIARCVAEGATLADFDAAIAHVAVTAWYQACDDNGRLRNRLAVICGKRFREHVRKGTAVRPGLGSTPPQAPAAACPAPVGEPLRRRYPASHPAFAGVDRENPRVWAGYVWTWSYASERWEMQGRDPNAQEVA